MPPPCMKVLRGASSDSRVESGVLLRGETARSERPCKSILLFLSFSFFLLKLFHSKPFSFCHLFSFFSLPFLSFSFFSFSFYFSSSSPPFSFFLFFFAFLFFPFLFLLLSFSVFSFPFLPFSFPFYFFSFFPLLPSSLLFFPLSPTLSLPPPTPPTFSPLSPPSSSSSTSTSGPRSVPAPSLPLSHARCRGGGTSGPLGDALAQGSGRAGPTGRGRATNQRGSLPAPQFLLSPHWLTERRRRPPLGGGRREVPRGAEPGGQRGSSAESRRDLRSAGHTLQISCRTDISAGT